MRVLLVLCVALAGCSDPATMQMHLDPDAPAPLVDAPLCLPHGRGAVTGTVIGAQVTPVVSVQVARYAGQKMIVFAETNGPDLCASPVSAIGDYLDFRLCANAAGSYPLLGSSATSCPGTTAGAEFGANQGNMVVVTRATSGTLDIQTVDATCMAGSFTVTFDSGDTATGSFWAAICP